MTPLPAAIRPVVTCPDPHRPIAMRALLERLSDLETEIEECRHRAKEIGGLSYGGASVVDELTNGLEYVRWAGTLVKAVQER